MAILIDKDTRLIVQGITGAKGAFHADSCRSYGTTLVGGVTPGKGGTLQKGIPVFNSVARACQETGANTSLIFVPAPAAFDALLEALDAGIALIICITEGIPVLDMVKIKRILPEYPKSRIIGPNSPGVISPGLAKAGIMPAAIHSPGTVGVVSRSGTLMYEAVSQLKVLGIGQSTCVGIGGDPIPGSGFTDILKLFEEDPETEAVLLIGEIGGSGEEEAAEFYAASMKKPMAAFIAGRGAPPGRRMGHAGAITGSTDGTAESKSNKLKSSGAIVAETPSIIGNYVQKILIGEKK